MTSDIDLPTFRAAYSSFLASPEAASRILLTGHSHQAWPDTARDALTRCFDDAARLVDEKWGAAVFPRVGAVGRNILARMGFDETDPIAFGKSTHELVFRLMTCLRPSEKPRDVRQSLPRVVTTDSEFHSLYRQASRLAEEGWDIAWVPGWPREGLADRILDALAPGTSMLALSAVMFEDAFIVPRLPDILARAREVGAIALVDAYHAFNVVPIEWGPAKQSVFVTAGGYKYASFGEGVCWLRIPADCALRPVDTGWFADFAALEGPRSHAVGYGPGGDRFSGGTFDPTCFYRAEAALAHWDRFGLSPDRLRAISLRQTARVIARLDERGLGDRVVSSRDEARRGGFVAVRAHEADAAVRELRKQNVFVDSRGDLLRIGPAPYLTDEEIDRGVDMVAESLQRG